MDDFNDSFVKDDVVFDESDAWNAEEGVFDPFQIGAACAEKLQSKKLTANPTVSTDNQSTRSENGSTVKSNTSSALPPRLMINFQVHEEISSTAHLSNEQEGGSDVQIQGTLMAQVVSSEALKNIPFLLESKTRKQNGSFEFIPNNVYAKGVGQQDENNLKNMSVVTIPKEVLGFVNVGTYRIAQSMEHMPLLLEQKVLHSKSTIKVAIQVRSKLSNPDDLSEFSIVVFIPSAVDKDSVTIASGNGEFDSFKRCITWGMEMLPKGESFMVSAKCALDKIFVASQGAKVLEELNFPVMLRCRSKDRLGSVRFETMEADGHPATISSSVVGKSYRIVHRLN